MTSCITHASWTTLLRTGRRTEWLICYHLESQDYYQTVNLGEEPTLKRSLLMLWAVFYWLIFQQNRWENSFKEEVFLCSSSDSLVHPADGVMVGGVWAVTRERRLTSGLFFPFIWSRTTSQGMVLFTFVCLSSWINPASKIPLHPCLQHQEGVI